MDFALFIVSFISLVFLVDQHQRHRGNATTAATNRRTPVRRYRCTNTNDIECMFYIRHEFQAEHEQ